MAELYLYDLVYRNRRSFRADFSESRRSFGYRFHEGLPLSPMTSYREFRQEVREAQEQYKYSLRMDVASYFNAIYHHDLVSFASEAKWSPDDVEGFGQLLREANAGRSIDCLPHGLNPTKTVGAEFLKFVDNNARLQCPLILRFTDDIYVFSNSFSDLYGDMLTIQGLLGEKSLSLNSAKTRFNEGTPDFAKTIGDMKIGLLRRRQMMIKASGGSKAVEVLTKRSLTADETDYLLKRLRDPVLEESDAELALVLLRDHGEEVLEKITDVLPRFPALTKTLHTYLRHAGELPSLGETIKGRKLLYNAA